MNQHFLAISLALVTACMLWMTGSLAASAVKRHDVTSAVSAVIAGALLSAIFLNAAVDLW